MKIKTCKPLNDGLEPNSAQRLWDDIEKFASYSFNKSHSVEYSLISYQSMWLKVYHPLEFFAAALTILKEEKRPGLIRDAKKWGIDVSPPDVNLSTDEFEIRSDSELIAPFSIMKGLSANGAKEVMKAREDGPFKDMKDFEGRVKRRVVNKAVREKLDLVGAFASVEPTQQPANHPDRRKDQLELVPSIMTGGAIVERDVHRDKATKSAISDLLSDFRDTEDVCRNKVFVQPRMGKRAKFMAIFDGPGYHDERAGRFATEGIDAVEEALEECGLEIADGYWTGLCKTPKAKEEKLWNPADIHEYKRLLDQEIMMLNPQVILCLGTNAARAMVSGMKGTIADNAGKILYQKATDGLKNDRNIVIGITPGMIYFDPDKQVLLNEAFQHVADMMQ